MLYGKVKLILIVRMLLYIYSNKGLGKVKLIIPVMVFRLHKQTDMKQYTVQVIVCDTTYVFLVCM